MKFAVVLILSFCLLGSHEQGLISRSVAEMVAHRGLLHGDNTMAAFREAVVLGFASVEADLQLRDGVVVLAHDRPAAGQRYDSLAQLLRLAARYELRLWLDLKSDEVVQPTIALLRHFDSGNVVVISASDSHLTQVQQQLPAVETGIIHASPGYETATSYDWLVLNKKLVTSDFRADKRVKIAVWTIKSQQEYRRIAAVADAVISDVQLPVH